MMNKNKNKTVNVMLMEYMAYMAYMAYMVYGVYACAGREAEAEAGPREQRTMRCQKAKAQTERTKRCRQRTKASQTRQGNPDTTQTRAI